MAKDAENGIKVPGEEVPPGAIEDLGTDKGQGGEPTPEELAAQQEQQEYEAAARAKGWKPKEEYEGTSGSWVGAEEFLKREPLFDKIKSQSRQIKDLTKTVQSMINQHKTQVEAQVNLRIKQLEEQKDEAIEAGDIKAVREIDKAINTEKQSMGSVNEEAPVPEEIQEWLGENQWFGKVKEMHDFAVAHNQQYMKSNPGDIEGSLKATRKAVERAFPDSEYFKKPSKPSADNENKNNPPSPEGGGEGKNSGGKPKWSMSMLDDEQKRVYEQHVKIHKIVSHDEFFQSLYDIGELQ